MMIIVSERKTHERGFMILAPKIRYSRRSLNIELPLFVLRFAIQPSFIIIMCLRLTTKIISSRRKGKDEECEWEDVTHHFKGKHVSYLEDAKNTRRDQGLSSLLCSRHMKGISYRVCFNNDCSSQGGKERETRRVFDWDGSPAEREA